MGDTYFPDKKTKKEKYSEVKLDDKSETTKTGKR